MRYKLLGNSGLRVSELCLGTMTFGEEWGWGAAFDESQKMFEAYAEAGGNFIDTANLYTNGTSEKFVGELVAGERDRWVVATKYSLNTGNGEINTGGNHRKNMVQAVNASLKRLKLDYIDLLWLHAWDFTTPVEEVMRAFDDLVRAGKVLYIGVSDTPAWIIAQANTLAQWRGWTGFIGLQIEYSLRERTPERDLLPMAKALGIGVTAWSPLGSGVLTGKYNQPTPVEGRLSNPQVAIQVTERDLKIAETVVNIAQEIGRAASQVALNWIRQQPGNIIPIIGARKLSHIQENLGCLDFELSPEHLKRLDEVSAIELGFPHDFLKSSMVQDFAFGGALGKIDR
ncbi:aldo/keto reductase [Gloeothece verrucosa]|uniref:Aldo/keto reductase n=1 Tax=Gloeothece verrucosa (strain PCC 7822) TaxID=497965 RepID=E0UA59_GLOV7|nr:aldo/keto reductase [Gloeothece verrucosa]ADN16251.1 aldo/keto reductase [Gloeothece verrucosa PCC 7822]